MVNGRTALVVWVVALLAAFFDGVEWSARVEATLAGAALEVLGLVLVTADITVPTMRKAWGVTSAVAASVLQTLGRLFGEPQTSTDARIGRVSSTTLVGGITPSGHLRLSRDPIHELQLEVNELRGRIAEVESAHRSDVAELRGDLERTAWALRKAIHEAIALSRGEYFGWRVLGLGIGFAGAIMLAVANLV